MGYIAVTQTTLAWRFLGAYELEGEQVCCTICYPCVHGLTASTEDYL